MNKIKLLESKKLIKELEYIQSDYNYKIELINESESEFLRSLNLFLEHNPSLKEVFDKKINQKIDDIFRKKQQEIDEIIQKEESSSNIQNDYEDLTEVETEGTESVQKLKLKKLYREIVKSTHPDRVTNQKLNELYLKATQYYNKNDFAGTYSICAELNINFEIDEDERLSINDQITNLKSRIEFMETTLTWKWLKSNDDEKQKILMNYLKLRLQN
jgi:hypothetical protein